MNLHCAWCERDMLNKTHAPYCCAHCEKKANKALAAINTPQTALQRENRIIRGVLVSLVAVITVTLGLRILAGSPPPPDNITMAQFAPSPLTDRNTAPYKAGQTARMQWNRWLGGQHGERRKGAIYWLNAVAGQHARQCDGTVEFALGCLDAHRHMDRIEAQFAISPAFRAGWDNP
ncbi:hypothetical protein GOB86_10640 [Acetobacter lambici]|uniref:Uncharacterized protein n=1 Tax=Acetobacter lambici TaxID=1332824 RepID=A0ABT1F298_9PROT|nr:hypothetical protein [Acetobacter lambici]MCP1243314.1 hypothetical protein [Acetobacter lambici]MCP1259311.1 hypothetical protein [Acetobacter lambici]NHO57505.1 hypothetical protein [Acetobacter lambici]